MVINLKILGAVDDQIAVVANNIQEIMVVSYKGKYRLQAVLVSGRPYFLVDNNDVYDYTHKLDAILAKQDFETIVNTSLGGGPIIGQKYELVSVPVTTITTTTAGRFNEIDTTADWVASGLDFVASNITRVQLNGTTIENPVLTKYLVATIEHIKLEGSEGMYFDELLNDDTVAFNNGLVSANDTFDIVFDVS